MEETSTSHPLFFGLFCNCLSRQVTALPEWNHGDRQVADQTTDETNLHPQTTASLNTDPLISEQRNTRLTRPRLTTIDNCKGKAATVLGVAVGGTEQDRNLHF